MCCNSGWSTQFIQFTQCFGNESIGITVRSLRTLPYPAKLPQYYLSYVGLVKERPGDEPSRLGYEEIMQPLARNAAAVRMSTWLVTKSAVPPE